jgi:CHAD domain-containing protein
MNDQPELLRDLVACYVAEQCRVLIEAESQLRAGEPVIHSTRVAVRRLRSTLRTCAELFDETRAEQLEPELVWWAGILGAVRDLDILAERMDHRLAGLPAELVLGPVPNTITGEISAQRQDNFKEVIEALDSSRYRELVIELHRWQGSAPFTEVAEVEAAEVNRYVKRAGKKFDKRLEQAAEACRVGDEGADELLHRSRKAGKRHRYVAELAQPVWGPKADKIVDRRKNLQDVLGDHQDSLVAAAFLRELGSRVGTRRGQNGLTYGILLGMEREHLEQIRDALARSKRGSAEEGLLALTKS